jgi:acetate kinase
MMPSRADENALILAINSGSSSLKLGFFREEHGDEQCLLMGTAERVGQQNGRIRLSGLDGTVLFELNRIMESQEGALETLAAVSRTYLSGDPVLVGHRIVHGGPELIEHQQIDDALVSKLRQAEHFAPLHIPKSLSLISRSQALFPNTPSFACFDTAFHRTLPEVAKRFALPASLAAKGIRRYGFHGLSYESIVHHLGSALPERVVLAHLGSGSSLCAVRSGVSIDTTMGLTPTGGIPMATRSGDLDPGVLLFLLRSEHMTVDELEQMLNSQSGWSAISGGGPDMRQLLASSSRGDTQAKLGVDLYVTAIRKAIGAYAALMSGIDLLVFTGGIGQNSEEIRTLVCTGLEFLGLSGRSNQSRVLAIRTEEERQIARICRRLSRPHI